MLNLYEEIRQKLLEKFPYITIEPVKELAKREDTAGWKKDYFNLFLKVKDYKAKKGKLLTKSDAREFLKKINSAGFLKKFFKFSVL